MPVPEDSSKADGSHARRLVKHALGVFTLSTWVAGLGQASMASKARNEAQFRAAHVGGTVHAALLFAIAGVLRHLNLNDKEKSSLVSWTAVLGWANSSGYLIGAMLGARGLTPTGNEVLAGGKKNMLPFSLFLVAIYSLIRVTMLTWHGTKEPASS